MDDYKNPIPGKTYISRAILPFGSAGGMLRIATKVVPLTGGYEYARERGEVVLRERESAATILTAKFLEDPRGISVLSIQRFYPDTGDPRGSGFSFTGKEIEQLSAFLSGILSISFEDHHGVKISDEDLNKITLNTIQAAKLVADNEELFTEVVRNAVTKEDVVAVGYRRSQLEIFKQLLTDSDYFEQKRLEEDCGTEALWQRFFEKNSWIFGYGLSYIYTAGLDQKRLEQVVKGFHVGQSGKRVDGLLKSKALASTLCFVEIKTHSTSLLKGEPYRSACWAPSSELSGAVAQIQGTVAAAAESILHKLAMKDDRGNPTGEIVFNFAPKSFVIVGSLSEFCTPAGVNEEKLRSFELYRRNIFQPELITFDELYERAKHIVQSAES